MMFGFARINCFKILFFGLLLLGYGTGCSSTQSQIQPQPPIQEQSKPPTEIQSQTPSEVKSQTPSEASSQTSKEMNILKILYTFVWDNPMNYIMILNLDV